MTPDFVLSLSFDGIALLLRSPEGERQLGEVPLDSADLAGDLAALRRAGEAAGVPWPGTVVRLPADQVKVLDLSGEVGEDEVAAALDGATPYPLSELVVDYRHAEGRTHVAAVARETLEEAEAFAAGFGFRPVRLVAPLPGTGFPGEADFGPTEGAAALLAEAPVAPPDEVAPEPDAAEAPIGTDVSAEADAAGAPDPEEVSAGVAEELPTPVGADVAGLAAADAQAPVTADDPVLPVADSVAPAAEDAPSVLHDFTPVEPPQEVPAEAEAQAEAEAPALVEDAAARPIALTPSAEDVPPAEAPASEDEAAVPEAVLEADPQPEGEATPGLVVSQVRTPLQGASRDPGLPAEAGRSGLRAEPPLRASKGAAAPPAGWALSAPVARPDPRLPPQVARPAAASPAVAAGPTIADAAPVAPTGQAPLRRVPFPSPPLAAQGTEPAAAVLATEAPPPRRVRRPLAPRPPRVGGKSRHLGLLLTLALLVLMAVVAWVTEVSPSSIAGLFRSDVRPVAEAPAPNPVAEAPAPSSPEAAQTAALAPAAPAASEAPARPAAEPVAAAPAAPSVEAEDAAAAAAAVAAAMADLPRDAPPTEAEPATASAPTPAPSGPDATPADAERIYAATGVWLRAPRLPGLPAAPADGGDAPALLAAVAADKAIDLPPVLAALPPDRQVDAGFLEPSRPGGAAAEAPADPALAPGAAAWANAMAAPPSLRPPVRPELPQDLVAAPAVPGEMQGPPMPPPGDSPAGTAWANALPEPPAARPPVRPEAPADFLAALPPPDGLVPVPPGTLAFAAEGEGSTPGGVGLDGLRPATRPEGLAPEEPAVQVLASFDGPRPGPRPEGLAPEELPEAPDVSGALAEALAEPEAPAAAAPPDLQSTLAAIVEGAPDPLAGATRLAVAAARVPEGRPRNFDRVVREQLERVASARAAAEQPRSGGGGVGTAGLEDHEAAEAGGAAEEASGAAAAPSGPTATTVAAAATLTDAMALREINLVGVYGQPGARRALVRMGNGRYLRVGIGDELDGGQVTAIGDNALNYVRRGRTEVLVIPGG